jgi:hypothetical protein
MHSSRNPVIRRELWYPRQKMVIIKKAVCLKGTAVQLFGILKEEIPGGLDVSVGVIYGLSENVLVGAEYGVLMARSQGNLTANSNFDLYVPAYEAGVFAKLALPVGDLVLFNVGAGIYTITTETAYYSTYDPIDGEVTDTFHGADWAYKFTGGAQLFLSPNLAVGADIGYRLAKINLVEDSYSFRYPNFTLDYSGVFGRGGIFWYF